MEIKENGIKDTLKTALFRYRAVLSVSAAICGAYQVDALSLGMPMVCGLDEECYFSNESNEMEETFIL